MGCRNSREWLPSVETTLRDNVIDDAVRRHRHADQSARILGHEVDRIGRHELRRHRQVAFVLALLVIDDDHEAAVAKVIDRFVDGRQA